jgi:RNA polymerase sigma factor for flagellar operon FliA
MSNIDSLWQAYASNKTPALKEKLTVHYAPLVKYVAGRLAVHVSQHVEYDDLVGYGAFGLIDAIEKFDPSKGFKFETYAAFRIKGTMIDHIRKLDWVPRALRQKNKQLEQVYAQFEEEFGRLPTEDELAEKLDISKEEAQDLVKKSAVLSMVSLDDYLEQNYEASFTSSLSDSGEESPEEQYSKQERKEMLADAINKLSERERLVVTLYYFEDLTVREISSIMKVSDSRVSQIHIRAISKLQLKLGKYKNLLFI